MAVPLAAFLHPKSTGCFRINERMFAIMSGVEISPVHLMTAATESIRQLVKTGTGTIAKRI